MGSTTHIVDEAGAVLNRYEYDAWGNITAQEETVPNRFKFTGQQLDPVTQQYYLRARFYSPVIARFMQEDTYRSDGLNLYAYCANNPVYYTDPSGYAAKAICKKKADSYYEIIENGGKLTLEQREELKRYERLKNNECYQYEAEFGLTPYEAYKLLHPEAGERSVNQPEIPVAEPIDSQNEPKRTYSPSKKHDPQAGWGSENPIPNIEVGQQLLDSAYSSAKNKQLYNIYGTDIIKFQPDSSSGEWHAYRVSNTATEVPTDVYRQMLGDGLISEVGYRRLIKNNWYR